MGSELEQIKVLYDLMVEKNLDELELKDEDLRIKLIRRFAGTAVAGHLPIASPVPADVRETEDATSSEVAAPEVPSVTAPLAGVFYRAGSPTAPPFVKEGDTVDPGQSLCIIEAMKVMNEIKAESRCRIIKIAVENGRPVTAGQPLFHIEPA